MKETKLYTFALIVGISCTVCKQISFCCFWSSSVSVSVSRGLFPPDTSTSIKDFDNSQFFVRIYHHCFTSLRASRPRFLKKFPDPCSFPDLCSSYLSIDNLSIDLEMMDLETSPKTSSSRP